MDDRHQPPRPRSRIALLLLIVATSLMASVIAQSLAQTTIAVGVAVLAVLAIAAATYWMVRRPPP